MRVARRFEDLIVWQLAVRIRDRVRAHGDGRGVTRLQVPESDPRLGELRPRQYLGRISALQPTPIRAATEYCERIAWRDPEPSAPWQGEEIFLGGRIHRPVAADVPRAQSRESSARLPVFSQSVTLPEPQPAP